MVFSQSAGTPQPSRCSATRRSSRTGGGLWRWGTGARKRPEDGPALGPALEKKVAALAATWLGLSVEDRAARLRIVIPDRYRVGHEAHFAEVTERFLSYLRDPAALPACEKANMLAKYFLTTRAVELSRRGPE